MKNREIVFWDCDDSAEYLYHQNKNEAIESFLDSSLVDQGFVEVHGYARVDVDREKFKKHILDSAMEYISENYDGEDGHKQSAFIEQAAESFVKTYLNEYLPWSCELVATEKVNISEWIKEHRPDWLKTNKEINDYNANIGVN